MQRGVTKFPFESRIIIQNDSVMIRSGYSATAEIVLKKTDSVLTVRERDLLFEDGPFVEILDKDSNIQRRVVEIGLSDGNYIEIMKGLVKDDKIKIQGHK
jgi:HlyD family secretion protein